MPGHFRFDAVLQAVGYLLYALRVEGGVHNPGRTLDELIAKSGIFQQFSQHESTPGDIAEAVFCRWIGGHPEGVVAVVAESADDA